ncbi:MAG: TRM11 family methyltransferase [Candidatus Poribacteria bacterium]
MPRPYVVGGTVVSHLLNRYSLSLMLMCSVYYFRYKKLSNHRGVIGVISETELVNLLGSRVMQIATPEIYPPGSIVWHAGDLTPNEIQTCQRLPFVSEIFHLEWTERQDGSENRFKAVAKELRQDYDAFLAFLESADHQLITTLDGSWVEVIVPQAFDYQSPARQSPYLIRAMLNLGESGSSITQVLDPMGGYGQTLFECVLRGIDGATLEISPKASHRSAENIRKLLGRLQIPFEEHCEENRYLFWTETSPRRCYQIVNGDTRRADQYFQGQQFDSLITDFPYGVQAGARTEKMQPTQFDQLLDSALPNWKNLLKPGGRVVIAYNLYTLARETVLKLIEKHRFRQQFAQVDLSERISDKIHRDIVVFEKAE